VIAYSFNGSSGAKN